MGTLIVNQYLNISSKLIDVFKNVVSAYSLRDLSNKTSFVVKVRRSSDNAEADFTSIQLTDGTLTSWVGVGNDGYVSTWYDQGENGNHAVELDLLKQPLIVKQGVLVEKEGLPTIDFSGEQGLAFNTFTVQSSVEMFVVFVAKTDPATPYGSGWIKIDTGRFSNHLPYGNGISYDGFGSTQRKTLGNLTLSLSERMRLYNPSSSPGEWAARFNENIVFTTDVNTVGIPSSPLIGPSPSSFKMQHFISELIIYDSVQSSSNRADISNNINEYYNLY